MPREFLGVKYFIRIAPDEGHVYQQFENMIEREWHRGVRSAEALGIAVTKATGGYSIGRNEIYAIVRELKRRDQEVEEKEEMELKQLEEEYEASRNET